MYATGGGEWLLNDKVPASFPFHLWQEIVQANEYDNRRR
jgi:hypothetical protein